MLPSQPSNILLAGGLSLAMRSILISHPNTEAPEISSPRSGDRVRRCGEAFRGSGFYAISEFGSFIAFSRLS